MATTDIGRAVPLLRGEYDPAQTYELNDIVSLNGSLYWHYSHEVTTNVAPQATSTWKVVLSLTDAEGYIARAETAAEEAESAKDDAVTAKTAAETASATATGASEAATAAKDDAVTARNAAQTAETGAVEAKNAAVSAKEAAQSAASSAGTSATSAGNSAGTAEYYAENAETAAETATTKASEASASATTASSAATTATEAKNTAVSSASTATTKAGEASTSATSAASSAAAAQAVKDSIPEDYSELSEDVSDLKTQIDRIKVVSIELSENVTTGYYIKTESPLPGKDWTTLLTAQTTSRYMPTAINLSDFIGGEVIISSSSITSSSSRVMGMCNENNIIVLAGSEGGMIYNDATAKYEKIFPINSDAPYLFFSISSTGSNGLSIVAKRDNLEYEFNQMLDDYENAKTDTCFVSSTTGNDELNNGKTRTAPFATIQKAIDSGYKNILVRPGVYTSGVNMQSLSGITIALDNNYISYSSSDPEEPKVIIDCANTLQNGVNITYCTDIVFENIIVKNATASGWRISKCQNIVVESCGVYDCPTGMGFEILYTNANFYNCIAERIGTMGGGQHIDGFNIKYTGTTNFYNCHASYCEDDGISHHDICQGTIVGGEFHHCGKGGVASPTHGSTVDISGVYCHDCGYGIYAHCDSETNARKFKVSNSVCKNNTAYDISVKNNTGIFWNCKYDTIDHSGNIGENIII